MQPLARDTRPRRKARPTKWVGGAGAFNRRGNVTKAKK